MKFQLIQAIEGNFQTKSTEELLGIWQAENREEYSDEAFEAARRILGSRGYSFPPKIAEVLERKPARPRTLVEAVWNMVGLAMLGIPVFFVVLRVRDCGHELNLKAAALRAIPTCQRMGEREIAVSGGVALVDDDYTDQKQFPFYTSRSEAVLGDIVLESSYSDVTIFVVRTTRLALVGNYAPGGGQAYRAQFDIYAVQFPRGEPLGTHTIQSIPPQEVLSSGGHGGEVIGNIDDVLLWIKSLPRKK